MLSEDERTVYRPRYGLVQRKADAGIMKFQYKKYSPEVKRKKKLRARTSQGFLSDHVQSHQFIMEPSDSPPKQSALLLVQSRQLVNKSRAAGSAKQTLGSQQAGTLSNPELHEQPSKTKSLIGHRRSSSQANEYLDFSKMPKRDFFLDRVQGAHDSRFETKKHLTKLRKNVPVPVFKNQTDRPSFTEETKIVKYLDGPPK